MIFWYIIAAYLFFPFAECQASAKDTGRNIYQDYSVIMISLSNVGTHHMSLYGYKRKTTPGLDKWAKDAIVFENAFSCGSWTMPVATSLFTSLYPYSHKVVGRDINNVLDNDIKTLPEILRDSGYKTAAFTGGLDYYVRFDHMRGFQDKEDNPNFSGFAITLVQAEKWLSENSNEKFFLFIHGYDTHCPFTPPDKFKGVFSSIKGKKIMVDSSRCIRGFWNSENKVYKAYYAGGCGGVRDVEKCPAVEPVELMPEDVEYLNDLYDEEVMSVDFQVVDFLNSLDKKTLDKTIIIILSEHGEMFAKHGRFGRAGTVRGVLYDDVVHIPLIIKVPSSSGRRIKGLVQIIDVMPTIFDMLGVHSSLIVHGKSLLPLIDGSRKNVNDYVYAGLPYNKAISSGPPSYYNTISINEFVRDYEWKLIREAMFLNVDTGEIEKETFELYNLKEDPNELVNVFDKFPEIALDLKDKLSRWAVYAKGFKASRPSTQQIPENIVQDAKKYGYW